MLGLEELSRRLRPDIPLGSKRLGRAGLIGESAGDLDLESIGFNVAELEWRSEPGRGTNVLITQLLVGQLLQPLRRQRMHPYAEQRPHLLRSHRVVRLQTVNSGHAGSDPRARRLAPLGIVGRECYMTLSGSVEGRHLPRQIVVPGTGCELVNAHCHSHLRATQRLSAVR